MIRYTPNLWICDVDDSSEVFAFLSVPLIQKSVFILCV